ncbi:hypothetical protein J3E72DRAFT_16306 [Bipolaris maydis]|nr:hypothetical protein J3E72DRAFT_16306 [Bipolaris maydis]
MRRWGEVCVCVCVCVYTCIYVREKRKGIDKSTSPSNQILIYLSIQLFIIPLPLLFCTNNNTFFFNKVSQRQILLQSCRRHTPTPLLLRLQSNRHQSTRLSRHLRTPPRPIQTQSSRIRRCRRSFLVECGIHEVSLCSSVESVEREREREKEG